MAQELAELELVVVLVLVLVVIELVCVCTPLTRDLNSGWLTTFSTTFSTIFCILDRSVAILEKYV